MNAPREDQALARRAAACRYWRWLPGMLTDCGERVTDPGVCYLGALPDLTDPPTLGGLLSLVRAAWEPHRGADYIASTIHTGSGWGVGTWFDSEGLAAIVLPTYETEATALVAALEAAP